MIASPYDSGGIRPFMKRPQEEKKNKGRKKNTVIKGTGRLKTKER